jgi:uncharacterized protein YceH (UPF0502 family)
MTHTDDEQTAGQSSGPRQLSRTQRRILGVLVEKAMTTPDQYPLTIKALTAGCNQKSNREPVTNYNEEQLERQLDDLRQLGLAAVVHTESGRTERFRHYVRKAYPFTEPQIAIMAELWLRGRQQLGELRTRASRMFPIESQEQLREELTSLLNQGYIQTSAALERRGAEVDHNFYLPDEGKRLEASKDGGDDRLAAEVRDRPSLPAPTPPSSSAVAELEERVATIEASLAELKDNFDRLRRELGAI